MYRIEKRGCKLIQNSVADFHLRCDRVYEMPFSGCVKALASRENVATGKCESQFYVRKSTEAKLLEELLATENLRFRPCCYILKPRMSAISPLYEIVCACKDSVVGLARAASRK
jgi:hypothetical protein